MTSTTDYTLRVATYKGTRVATFASIIVALRKMADDYETDGEREIAIAFRMSATSLCGEA